MFSNMKWKEYMEYELFGIFRVKVVAKNILFGFLGTQRQSVFFNVMSLEETNVKENLCE